MSNSNAPFGFSPSGTSSGMPNYRISTKRIASTNTGAIYKGDPVSWVSNTPTGYIKQATAAEFATNTYNNSLAGIFWGCTYLSTSRKQEVWSPYWPGADATGDVIAYVIDDPHARFTVMGNSTDFNITGTIATYTTSPIGRLCTFVVGSGSTTTGLSGAYAATPGATGPFMVVDLVTSPPGANGADPTTAYNWIVVGFSTEWLRLNGASTGVS